MPPIQVQICQSSKNLLASFLEDVFFELGLETTHTPHSLAEDQKRESENGKRKPNTCVILNFLLRNNSFWCPQGVRRQGPKKKKKKVEDNGNAKQRDFFQKKKKQGK